MDREEFFHNVRFRSAEDIERIQHAYWLSKKAHDKQARDGGERYFEHPRRAAVKLIEFGYLETAEIVTALLHDVIEDTVTPLKVIVNLFGAEIWERVQILSRSIPTFDPISGQIIARAEKDHDAYYRAIAAGDRIVRLTKIADRLDNLITIAPFEPPRKRRYLDETRQYVLPIARMTCPRFTNAIEEQVRAVEDGLRHTIPA